MAIPQSGQQGVEVGADRRGRQPLDRAPRGQAHAAPRRGIGGQRLPALQAARVSRLG